MIKSYKVFELERLSKFSMPYILSCDLQNTVYREVPQRWRLDDDNHFVLHFMKKCFSSQHLHSHSLRQQNLYFKSATMLAKNNDGRFFLSRFWNVCMKRRRVQYVVCRCLLEYFFHSFEPLSGDCLVCNFNL